MEEWSSQNSSLETQEKTLGPWEQKTVSGVCDWDWARSTPLPTTCKANAVSKVLCVPDSVLEYFGCNYMRKGENPTTNIQPSTAWRELETKSACVQVCRYSLLLIKVLYIPAWDNRQVLASLSFTDRLMETLFGNVLPLLLLWVFLNLTMQIISQFKYQNHYHSNIFLWGICNWKLLPLLKSTAFYRKYTIHIQQKKYTVQMSYSNKTVKVFLSVMFICFHDTILESRLAKRNYFREPGKESSPRK